MSRSHIAGIFRREFRSYWYSPALYIVGAVFLLILGWFFFSTFFLANRADLRGFFSLVPVVLAFTVPALTMKSFAEEFKSGSYEMLGTLPVSVADIVVGKYLAVTAASLALLIPTLLYPLVVSTFGDLDWGPVFGGYLGMILLVSAYCALGVLASSFSANQIIAFIAGAAILFFLVMVDKMIILLPSGVATFFQYLGSDYHFVAFARGIVDSRDILYFITVTVLGLQATWLVVTEKHR